MKPSSLIILLPLVLIVAALRGSADPSPSEPHIGAIDRHAVVAETRVRPLVISGHLAPVDHEELRLVCLQPRTGEVLEVVDHGTFVNEGDMVLRLDPRSLEREVVLYSATGLGPELPIDAPETGEVDGWSVALLKVKNGERV